MANNIALAREHVALLDEVYATESLTAGVLRPPKVKPTGRAGSFLVQRLTLTGAGNYSKADGHPRGAATLVWDERSYAADRGRSFTLDSMDALEAQLDAVTLLSEFVRTRMTPEVDAYRFARWASTPNIGSVTGANLADATAVLTAYDTAVTWMKNRHVKERDLVCFMAVPVSQRLKGTTAGTRLLSPGQSLDRGFSSIDGVPVIEVPQDMFVTQVTLDPGATAGAGGFTKTATTGRDLNFLIVDTSAVFADMKHGRQRMFDPESNQAADGWKLDYRAYHDAWVFTAKTSGVYAHSAAV